MNTLSFCLALLLAAATATSAQTFYGVAGGLNYAGSLPNPNSGLPRPQLHGFTVQGTVGRQFGDRLALRLDASLHRFPGQTPDVVVALCPPNANCASPPANPGTVGLTALRANALLTLDPPAYAVRMYLIGGFGGYYFYQHPTIEGAIRPGVSGGVGFNIRVNGRSRFFVEGLYNKILGAPSEPNWLLPFTVGVRF